MLDCDWLPYDVFDRDCRIADKELQLHGERYKVLVVPPVEVIPYATLAKAKAFLDAGGIVISYGFLPSKSATLGHSASEIVSLCKAIWDEQPVDVSDSGRIHVGGGGQSFFLSEKPTPQELQNILANAGVRPGLKVLAGETDGWLHVLHRVKDDRDVFLVCNQNHQGAARQFKFRAAVAGEPECWDPMRNEITAIPFQRMGRNTVEFSLRLEPLESVLLIFQPNRQHRPMRIMPNTKPVREPISLVRIPNPPMKLLVPEPKSGPLTLSPVKAADPFRASFTIPEDMDLSTTRVDLEMADLPDLSASVTINGIHAGGVIGKPLRLDIHRSIKAGDNTVVIEPLAPKAARIVFYGEME
jgi:hypothetical protein